MSTKQTREKHKDIARIDQYSKMLALVVNSDGEQIKPVRTTVNNMTYTKICLTLRSRGTAQKRAVPQLHVGWFKSINFTEVTMKVIKKIALSICFIFPLTVYALAGDEITSLTAQVKSDFLKYGKDVIMMQMLNDLIPSLPIAIDADVRVEAASYAKNTISQTRVIYSELGESLKHDALECKKAKKLMRQYVVKEICTTPITRALLNNGITYYYNYYSNDRTFLFSNNYSVADCKKQNL